MRNFELLFGSCSSKFQLDLALPDQAGGNAFQQSIIMGIQAAALMVIEAVAEETRTGDNHFKSHSKNPIPITGLEIPVIQKKASYPKG